MSNPFIHHNRDLRNPLVRHSRRPSANRDPYRQLSPEALQIAQEWYDEASEDLKRRDEMRERIANVPIRMVISDF